jgi:hypothetical protein
MYRERGLKETNRWCCAHNKTNQLTGMVKCSVLVRASQARAEVQSHWTRDDRGSRKMVE